MQSVFYGGETKGLFASAQSFAMGAAPAAGVTVAGVFFVAAGIWFLMQ